MITALYIRSFLLIDRLDLECRTGFTSLTGETGAGKSIILDALSLILGGPADKSLVRSGCEQSSLTAQFEIPSDHALWAELSERGIEVDPGACLTLRRIVHAQKPSRAFINDQAVSAATLSLIGSQLVDIHSQHAASRLMRPATHRDILDAFAQNETERMACQTTWHAYVNAREAAYALQEKSTNTTREIEWLSHAVEELQALSVEADEATRLSEQRATLMQSEKFAESLDEAVTALSDQTVEAALSRASRASERVARLLEPNPGTLADQARQAADAIERTLIELGEAQSAVRVLASEGQHDPDTLERIETRLFALRAAGRKYEVDPDTLDTLLLRYVQDLEAFEQCDSALSAARAAEVKAEAAWRNAADKLSNSRRRAANELPLRIGKELSALHLGRVEVRVDLQPLAKVESGAFGQERITFEAKTNAGTAFGPLSAIASGGELARFSLALQCALSHDDGPTTLIFDEADQGVGGAVAAAIGERLSRLSNECQVFAITHSPQVASHADRQWRVRKFDQGSETLTQVTQLSDGERLEEIARMLSGSSVTDEARAAASKLLEAA